MQIPNAHGFAGYKSFWRYSVNVLGREIQFNLSYISLFFREKANCLWK